MRPNIMGFFLALTSGDCFFIYEAAEIYFEVWVGNKDHLLWFLIFETGFM